MQRFTLYLASFTLAAATLAAQPRFTGFVGGGPGVPINPIGARLDNGWNVSAGAGVTGRYAGLNLDFTYNDFGINQTALASFGALRFGSKVQSRIGMQLNACNRRRLKPPPPI